MKRVVLESPYRGHGETEAEIASRTKWHVEYARLCIRDSLRRGEAPIASHLLYTQPTILQDNDPLEREQGIKAGWTWIPYADYSVYYTDHGWSAGMLGALHEYSIRRQHDFRIRSLNGKRKIQLPLTLDEEVEKLLRNNMEDTP